MGFTFNGVTSKSMKIRARLSSWQAYPSLRNFYETVPGKAGVADFGCDSAERTIKVECSVFPQKNFPALVAVLTLIIGGILLSVMLPLVSIMMSIS